MNENGINQNNVNKLPEEKEKDLMNERESVMKSDQNNHHTEYEMDTAIDPSIEEKLQNAGLELPEGLSVESMMAKIAKMSPEELAARRESVDLPEDMPEAESSDGAILPGAESGGVVSLTGNESGDGTISSEKRQISGANIRSANDRILENDKAGTVRDHGTDGSEPEKKASFIRRYRRFIYPMASAAALLIVVGIAVFAGKNGMLHSGSESAKMAESAAADMAATADAYEDADDAAYMEGESAMSEAAADDMSNAVSGAVSSAAASSEAAAGDDDAGSGQYEKAYERLEQMQQMQTEMLGLMVNGAAMEETAEEAVAEDMPAPAGESDDAENFYDAPNVSAGHAAGEAVTKNARGALTAEIADDTASEGVDFTDTNVRTQGVLQGDIVKTDGKYIYVYDERTEHIRIYEPMDGKTEEIGSVSVVSDITRGGELYVLDDTLVFMGESNEGGYEEVKTVILLYDISDRYAPAFKTMLTQDGSLYSSRLTDGILYTFSKKWFDLQKVQREVPRTYIPMAEDQLIRPDDICVPPDIMQSEYVVITSLDITQDTFADKKAVLAGSDLLYVSADQIYLADQLFSWSSFEPQSDTQILRFSYQNGVIGQESKGTVPGYIKDDYCMDERNGKLRLVTTYTEDGATYNALYVLDENLKRIGVIKKIAEGETIRSARFLGDTAYFVTFRNTDPLFAVDLSDDTDPRIIGYIKLPGFSAYLHPLGDDFMLGIGYHTDQSGFAQGVKVSVYYMADPKNIQETDTIEMSFDDAVVLQNPKALYFDPDKKLFGFAAFSYDVFEDDDPQEAFLVFSYEDPVCIDNVLTYEFGKSGGTMARETRGMRIGDHLYVVTAGYGISSFDATNMKIVQDGVR